MVVHELEPHLSSIRSTSVSVVAKVLTSLGFYATGSYQRTVGQATQHSLAQQTVSKCLREVTLALNHRDITRKFIKFPQTVQERNIIKKGFYDEFQLPRVMGCVDGTHIAIIRPSAFEERYYKRKHYHSLNAQIESDSNLNILSIDASYGGASHDSYIWEHHPLRQHVEYLQQTESAWFLGDSGYSQRKWMMTPIINAADNTPDAYYSQCQKTARNSVERTIGVLKARWRCLLVHRVLHYDPRTAGMITNACAVLHNIANAAGLPVPRLSEEEERQERERQIFRSYNDREAGVPPTERFRNRLLRQGRDMRSILVQRLWRDRRN